MRFCGLLLALTPMVFAAAEYRAGVARVDITPPIGHQMGGYAARKHGSTGLHDPLYATVLVIETANNSVAFVTCDLRSFVSTRVGELAKQKFNIQTTLIDVSHDHWRPCRVAVQTWRRATRSQQDSDVRHSIRNSPRPCRRGERS